MNGCGLDSKVEPLCESLLIASGFEQGITSTLWDQVEVNLLFFLIMFKVLQGDMSGEYPNLDWQDDFTSIDQAERACRCLFDYGRGGA